MKKRRYLLVFLGLSLLWVRNVEGKSDFIVVSEKQCFPIEAVHVNRLPAEFKKYINSTKKCEVKNTTTASSKLSIISIWVDDYYLPFVVSGRPQKWEKFPLPLIVNNDFEIIGRLPEIFPKDDVTEPTVYFGKWKDGMPGEIRVDVTNPAVDGDYYYPSILWNPFTQQYEMKKGEVIHGIRR